MPRGTEGRYEKEEDWELPKRNMFKSGRTYKREEKARETIDKVQE